MAVRLRAAAWIAVAALWGLELGEGLGNPNWLNPQADFTLDGATVVLTVLLGVWHLAERYGHPRIVADLEKRLDAQDEAWNTWRAATGQKPVLRVAGEPEKR
jgi:hypothetical protein